MVHLLIQVDEVGWDAEVSVAVEPGRLSHWPCQSIYKVQNFSEQHTDLGWGSTKQHGDMSIWYIIAELQEE